MYRVQKVTDILPRTAHSGNSIHHQLSPSHSRNCTNRFILLVYATLAPFNGQWREHSQFPLNYIVKFPLINRIASRDRTNRTILNISEIFNLCAFLTLQRRLSKLVKKNNIFYLFLVLCNLSLLVNPLDPSKYCTLFSKKVVKNLTKGKYNTQNTFA